MTEREFIGQYVDSQFRDARKGGVIAVAVLGFALVVKSFLLDDNPALRLLTVQCFVAALALVGAFFFLTTRSAKFRTLAEVMSPVLSIAFVSIGFAFAMHVAPWRRESSYGAFMLATIPGYSLMRSRFSTAAASGLACSLTFLVLAYLYEWYEPMRFRQITMYFSALNAWGCGICFMIERKDRLLYLFNQEVEFEKSKAEQLLFNMLPAQIATKLKYGNEMIAESHADASVMFADIVGFTELSESMPATRIVAILGELFAIFDGIVEKEGLEKIKTIGDSYMAASGIPTPCFDHAERIARAAIAMREAASAFWEKNGLDMGLRLGINSGPLVAGVIYGKKMIYDVWGSTVNVASRMESHGRASEIQISRATHDLIEGKFRFSPPVKVHVKGVGEMETFFLEPRQAAVGVALKTS